MSTANGTLLWNRQHLTLSAGLNDVDTGLIQQSQAFGASSANEPPLGIAGTTAPAPGSLPASRVQVIPLPPTPAWTNVTISEPWVSTVTGTVHVTFTSSSEVPIEVNVLFWDPHTSIGPGQADPYNDSIG
jgi:hypothetical protein